VEDGLHAPGLGRLNKFIKCVREYTGEKGLRAPGLGRLNNFIKCYRIHWGEGASCPGTREVKYFL
jgi:hypothetical protein